MLKRTLLFVAVLSIALTVSTAAWASRPVVPGVLFWAQGCPHCEVVRRDVLPTLQARYGPQLDIHEYVPARETTGGKPLAAIRFANPDSSSPANNGFGIAYAIMIGMVAAIVYALVISIRAGGGAIISPGPAWAGTIIVVLAVLGMGVAIYLTFVETQNVAAVCGPIGDCNAVQSSPYARLFGILPVGLLGLIGYIAILIAWILGRATTGRIAGLAHLAMFGMALFGVLFSLYLTYLEPFVIRAVCAWCLTNAVLITLIMLLSVRPALATLGGEDEFEEVGSEV